MIYQKEIKISTSGHKHVQDLTPKIQKLIDELDLDVGLINIFNIGSTGAIISTEFEPGLEEDIPNLLDRLIPPGLDYAHEQTWHDNNGHSHLQALMLGASFSIPFKDGKLILGTWQQILHVECDIKPHERILIATIYSD